MEHWLCNLKKICTPSFDFFFLSEYLHTLLFLKKKKLNLGNVKIQFGQVTFVYIYITSLIHSRIPKSVKAVCFKAFIHRSNLNLCSTACWGFCNSVQHFPNRKIMNEHSGRFFPHIYRIKTVQIILSHHKTVVTSCFVVLMKWIWPCLWIPLLLCINTDSSVGILSYLVHNICALLDKWCISSVGLTNHYIYLCQLVLHL